MTKRSRKISPLKPALAPEPSASSWSPALPLLLLAVGVIAFSWLPLMAADAHIQWDAIDVHYSSQRYLSESLHRGVLPFWTPYIFSGFPFLADPQVGTWYPLNWPFLAAGITPKQIELELILHVAIACAGAYLLATRLLNDAFAGMCAGFVYGLSGFFTAHSSHVGMVQTAAWLPWILLALHQAAEVGAARWAWTSAGGLIAGAMILAGHPQTTIYAVAALVVFTIGEAVAKPSSAMTLALSLGIILTIAVLLSAVQTAPAALLLERSIRSGMDTAQSTDGVLRLVSLATLVRPDALGALSGAYRGPDDVTQHYLYMGLATLPLALAGLWVRSVRRFALALLVPFVWFAFGPNAGFYRIVVSAMPVLAKLRAPVHSWFVPALAIALLAASGISRLVLRPHGKMLATGLLAILFADLWYWNAPPNPIGYAPSGYHSGIIFRDQERFHELVVASQPANQRLAAFRPLPAGSRNHPLDLHLEATYGYNPLELRDYAEYHNAMAINPRLMNGLDVGRFITIEGVLTPNPANLGRIYFPAHVTSLASIDDVRARLLTTDPAQESLIVGAVPGLAHDPNATLSVTEQSEQRYVIDYVAADTSLIRVAIPYYPGWCAMVEGQPCEIIHVDHALMGIVAPPGSHRLTLEYRPPNFWLGASLSLMGLLSAFALILAPRFRHLRST